MSFYGGHPGDPPPKPRPNDYEEDDEPRYDLGDPPPKPQPAYYNNNNNNNDRERTRSQSYDDSPDSDGEYDAPEPPPRQQSRRRSNDRQHQHQRNEERAYARSNSPIDHHIPAEISPPTFYDEPLEAPDPYYNERYDDEPDYYQSSEKQSMQDDAGTLEEPEDMMFLRKDVTPTMSKHAKEKDVAKASKTKTYALVAVGAVFLGGMGALAWFLSTIIGGKGAPAPVNATDEGSNAPTSAPILAPPPPDFAEKCRRDVISASPVALVGCEGVCGVAECCYDNTCFFNNTETCASYSPLCDFLYGSLPSERVAIPEPPVNLTSLCSPSAWNKGGQEACIDACYDGYCCFSSTSSILLSDEAKPSCFETNVNTCTQYAPCAVILISKVESLMVDSSGGSENGTNATSPDDLANGTSTTNRVSSPRSNLAQTCSGDSLDTQPGFLHCISDCSKATCCTVADGPTSCLDEYAEVCNLYAPCYTLIDRLENGISENNSTNKTQLEPPPDSIDEACYSSSIIKKAVCRNICEGADCCFSATDSCGEENPTTCAKYSPCQCLVDDQLCKTVDDDLSSGEDVVQTDGNSTDTNSTMNITSYPLPDNITDICYSDSIPQKVACGNLCEPAECCFVDAENCVDDYEELCTAYRPCLCLLDDNECPDIGDGSNVTLLAPPDDLNATCSPEVIAVFDNCTDACNEALCCFEVGSSCNASQPEICSLYSPCMILLGADENQTKPHTLSAVEMACSVDSIDTEKGGMACTELCLDGSCCFIEFGDEASCVDDITSCAYYRPCSLIKGDIPWPVLNSTIIEESCQPNSTETEEGKANCTDLCETGRCCFINSNDIDSCADEEDFCRFYRTCESVFAEVDSPVQPPTELANLTDVEQACQIANLADGAVLESCTTLCADSECCFAVDGKNATCADDLQFCTEFEVCAVIFDPTNSTRIVEACDPGLINSTDGRVLCMDLCTVGSCCWDELEKDSSCADRTDFCTDYEPCFALLGENTTMIGNGTDAIDTEGLDDDSIVSNSTLVGCTLDDISKGNLTECEGYCEQYACCYDGTECEDDAKAFCGFLVPVCADILDGNITIAQACNADFIESNNIGNASCLEQCAVGACCFVEPVDKDSCVDDFGFCSSYQPCNLVLGETEVVQACNPDSIALDGEQPCQDLCENGLCCHVEASNETSCRDDLGLCTYFESCKVLVGETKLAVACDADAISTDGSAACLDLCGPGLCCFENPANETSCSKQIGTCAYYEPCKGVIPENEVEKACSAESVATENGTLACQDLCADGDCCFLAASDEGSCVEEPGYCSYFEPCGILAENQNSSSAAAQTATPTETAKVGMDIDMSVEAVAEPLQEVPPVDVTDQVDKPKSISGCTADNIANGNVESCYELCQELSCCFEDNSCGVTEQAQCKEYMPVCNEVLGIS